jgi:septum formation protein
MEVMSRGGLRFDVVRPGIDEVPPLPMSPIRHVQWAAEAKARAVAGRIRNALVIGADTEVVLDGQVFGKPIDRPHARRMLRALSGRTHVVYTAIHVIDTASGRNARGFSRTRVTLRRLSERQIDAYVRSGEVQDKAGAYAIQARGRSLVRTIQGPFDNVVGMPMHLLRRLLREHGMSPPPPPQK